MQTKKYVILVDLLKKTDYNTKITKIESRTPSISGLATITALTAVENKISDVSNQFKKKKKTDYDAKISDIESKYITTADYNKFTKNIVDNNIKSRNLVDKSAIARSINNDDLDRKVATLVTKAELTAEQDKITKLQAFDSSYFRGIF